MVAHGYALKCIGIKCQSVHGKQYGHTRKNSLEFFDIAFTDKHIITICDSCNEALFDKTLKATVSVNAKLKSNKDIAIIQNRRIKKNKDI